MKTLLAASAVGSLLGVVAAPALQAPAYANPPKPFSLFGTVTMVNSTTGVLTFPAIARDFVLTDVIPGAPANASGGLVAYTCRLLSNGNPILELGWKPGSSSGLSTQGWLEPAHFESGLLIQGGTTLSIAATSYPYNGTFSEFGVTLSGFIYQ